MKNLLQAAACEHLLARFDQLEPKTEARWGRMNVEQMICHVSDPLRIAFGELEAADVSNFMTRTLLRWLVLAGMPPPKGKVDTFAEIDQVKGAGTPPTSLDQDRETLKSLVERFVAEAPNDQLTPSPGFGRMSGRQYARLFYVHMDYHLKQFGV